MGEPAWLPQAHADSGSCPDGVADAADDAAWAADRIASITDKTVTFGLFYDADGMEHEYDSQKGAASDLAVKVGRDAQVFPRSGRPNVVDHVEVKAAAAMRDSDETVGVLVINNPDGPCKVAGDGQVAPMSCLSFPAEVVARRSDPYRVVA